MDNLRNDRYLRALLSLPVDRTPVWMMRQAGRYLPEYRKLREVAGSFMHLCKNPIWATEVTLQPLRRFNFDAAIIFSDILTIPDAMGLGLSFTEGEGPRFAKPIQSRQDIHALPRIDPNRELSYVMESIHKTRQQLAGEVPLIGFSGSPWTLATYMIEGGGSKTFSKIKKWLYTESEALKELLGKVSESITSYLNAQIDAGAQSLMIFDTWGGILSHDAYNTFSLPFMSQIVKGLKRGKGYKDKVGNYVPVTLFTKGGGLWLEDIMASGCDAVGVDWTVHLGKARKLIAKSGKQVALQGNLDPAILYGSEHTIYQQVSQVLAEYGTGSGHVFNLGHGIMQDAPIPNVEYCIKAVENVSKRSHL